MKRFTKNNKPVKSRGQFRHLVFKSQKHNLDRVSAHNLISTKYIRLKSIQKEIPKCWAPSCLSHDKAKSYADDFSFNMIFTKEGNGLNLPEFELADETETVEFLEKHSIDAGWYWAQSGMKRKDGSEILKKRKYNGLNDIAFNLSPWVSESLMRLIENEKNDDLVRMRLKFLALKLAEKIKERSGYKVVAVALHPDAGHKLGFHFTFKQAENGNLIGRSANGKRGRKGLRVMGHSNLSIYNMNKVAPVIVDLEHRYTRKDWDDKALSDYSDELIQKIFGDEFWHQCVEKGKWHVFKWNKKIYNEQYVPRYQEERIEHLRNELAALEPTNPTLSKDIPPDQSLIKPLNKNFFVSDELKEFHSKMERRNSGEKILSVNEVEKGNL